MLLIFFLAVTLPNTFAFESKPSEWTCGQAFQINSTHSATFDRNYDDTKKLCKYELIGERGCEVEVSCNIDIPESPNCEENYLHITDGYRGSKKYCGKSNPQGIRASVGLRDLFLVLSTNGNIPTGNNFNGISCTAKCVSNPNLESGRLAQNWERHVDNRCVCGLQQDDGRIVGGEDAKYMEFPWLVAVVVKGTRAPLCGASLINDRFVLFAAHCSVIGEKQAHELEVLINAHVLDMTVMKGFENDTILEEDTGSGFNLKKMTDEDEKTLRIGVEELINHPLYTKMNDYDFSLLRLKKPINFGGNDAHTPVCLPPADTFDQLELKGRNFTVAGWGLHKEKAKATTRVLQKLVIPFLPKEDCQKQLPKRIILTGRMICGGDETEGTDACNGDSGGPLIIQQQPSKQWWQVGVVSWGIGCARAGRPGVHAQVTEGAQWINFHAAHHNAKWCSDDATTGRHLEHSVKMD